MKETNYNSLFLLVILGMIWGSSFILIKKGLLYMSADELGALRILLSSVALLPLAIKSIKKYNKGELLYLGLAGLTGSLAPAFLFAYAEIVLHSSVTGVLNSMTPVFTLIAGIFFFKIKPEPRSILGVILGLSGAIMLVVSNNNGEFDLKNIEYGILPILGSMSYGININLVKKKLSHIPSMEITACSFLIIGIPAFIYLCTTSLFYNILNTPDTIKGLGYVSILSLVGTAIALMLFNRLIKSSKPVFASSVTYLIPIFAIIWGILDGEQLNESAILWCSLILLGIFLINAPTARNKDKSLNIRCAKLKKV